MKVLSFPWQPLLGILLYLLLPFVVEAQQNPFEIQGRSRAPAPANVDTQATVIGDTIANFQPNLMTVVDTVPNTVSNDSIALPPFPLLGEDTMDMIDTAPTNPFDQAAQVIETPQEEIPVPDTKQVRDSTDLLGGFKEISERLPEIEIGKNQNILFVITVLILLLLAVLLALNRSMINKAYRAIANDNFLRFLFREYKSTAWLYWTFYVYFFINAGFFLYLMASYFGWFGGKLSLLILSIAFVTFVYLFKHLSLQIMSGSFPIEKETQLYGFVTMLINILLGIVLTPINLACAFAPEPFAKWAIWLGILSIASLYIFRQLKGLFISGRFLHSYRFHFFIYLCTAEIAPLLIIGKLAIDNIGL